MPEGTLRFITGKPNHDADGIVTPTATIGVPGIAFDIARSRTARWRYIGTTVAGIKPAVIKLPKINPPSLLR